MNKQQEQVLVHLLTFRPEKVNVMLHNDLHKQLLNKEVIELGEGTIEPVSGTLQFSNNEGESVTYKAIMFINPNTRQKYLKLN